VTNFFPLVSIASEKCDVCADEGKKNRKEIKVTNLLLEINILDLLGSRVSTAAVRNH
jgi:hypothetical protein